MWRARGAALITYLAWGWLTTAYTSLVAQRSDWAVGLDVALTALGLVGMRMFVTKPGTLGWLLVGGALGTWLGLRWP